MELKKECAGLVAGPVASSLRQSRPEPPAERAGIGKVGWHTFRHTYSTLLHALGTKPAVQKELLRHADIRTTMNVYTQAMSDDKREAVSKVARTLCQTILK